MNSIAGQFPRGAVESREQFQPRLDRTLVPLPQMMKPPRPDGDEHHVLKEVKDAHIGLHKVTPLATWNGVLDCVALFVVEAVDPDCFRGHHSTIQASTGRQKSMVTLGDCNS